MNGMCCRAGKDLDGLPARQYFLREAMSHAQTGWQTDSGSSLTAGRMTDWMHTANAVTVRG